MVADPTGTTMAAALERFIAERVGETVDVADLQRISSVGNAREPWSFTARWAGGETRCVMLVKAAAGQLETTLRPEYETIASLEGTAVPVPRAMWLDDTGEAFGREFFVTGWVPGSADTRAFRAGAIDGEIDGATNGSVAREVRAVARELAVAAANLHGLDVDRFAHLPATTADAAAREQLDHWGAMFLRQRLEPHPTLAFAVRWLRQRPPRAQRVSLVHGDLRFGNLLAADGRLTALLDWEMTHLGDPLEDLGWVYRAVWSPAAFLPFEEFLATYVEAGGGPVDPDHLRWWRVFSEFKHAVISLTGTRTFADGATTALRHANRAATVPAFCRRLLELIEEPVEELTTEPIEEDA